MFSHWLSWIVSCNSATRITRYYFENETAFFRRCGNWKGRLHSLFYRVLSKTRKG